MDLIPVSAHTSSLHLITQEHEELMGVLGKRAVCQLAAVLNDKGEQAGKCYLALKLPQRRAYKQNKGLLIRQLSEGSLKTNLELGDLFKTQGRLIKAADCYRKFVETGGDVALGLEKLVAIELLLGKGDSIEDWERVVCHRYLVQLLKALGAQGRKDYLIALNMPEELGVLYDLWMAFVLKDTCLNKGIRFGVLKAFLNQYCREDLVALGKWCWYGTKCLGVVVSGYIANNFVHVDLDDEVRMRLCFYQYLVKSSEVNTQPNQPLLTYAVREGVPAIFRDWKEGFLRSALDDGMLSFKEKKEIVVCFANNDITILEKLLKDEAYHVILRAFLESAWVDVSLLQRVHA